MMAQTPSASPARSLRWGEGGPMRERPVRWIAPQGTGLEQLAVLSTAHAIQTAGME
jgi:hypothetical protein